MSISFRRPISRTWRAISEAAWACVVVPAEQNSVVLASRYDPSVAVAALTIIAAGFVLGAGFARITRAAAATRS